MENSNGMLKIVRGAREVARARGGNGNNRSSSSKTSATGRSNPNKQNTRRRSRMVPGQVGVAVKREDSNRRPLSTSEYRYGERDEEEDDRYGYHAFAGGTTTGGPSTENSQPAGPLFHSRPNDGTEPSTLVDKDHGAAAVEDLTADSPEPERGGATTITDRYFADFANPGRHLESSSGAGAGGGGQPLGPWLLSMASSPKAAPKRSNNNNNNNNNKRRQRPLQSATENSDEFPRSKRAWGAVAPGQDNSRAGGGDGVTLGRSGGLSAWLEPRPSATSRKNEQAEPKRGGTLEGVVAAGYGQSDGRLSDDDSGNNDGDSSCNDDDDDDDDGNGNGKWMSDRLEGLDPSGAARAKDSWTDRERRNLTCTDVALGAKRKGRGRGGWRTKAGSKVFVASGRRGSAVRVPKAGGGKKPKR